MAEDPCGHPVQGRRIGALAQIDAHRARLQRDYPWITVNRSDAARDLLMRALQACVGDPEPGPLALLWRPGTTRPRLQVRTLLQTHPAELTPAQVQERLGCPKDLAPTIRSMARDGLLRRVRKGVYTAAIEE